MTVQDGFLPVDKPAGVTSFAVVDRVRRLLLEHDPARQPPRRRRRGRPKPPRYKCGHAGTLDPLATGLLLVLTGRATRLVPFLSGLDKTYRATLRCGAATDSLDADGVVTAEAPVPASADAFAEVLDDFRGEIDQVPPLVSALKRNGRPLHARVRAGEEVAEPEARTVRVDRLEIVDSRWPDRVTGHHEIEFAVSCSSGTYVRSLGRDLALAAGTLGHLAALRRLSVGPFAVDEARLDVFACDAATAAAAVRPAAEALPWVPCLSLDDAEASSVRTGGQPRAEWAERLVDAPAADGLVRLLDPAGGLLAVGRFAPEPRLLAVLAGAPRPPAAAEEEPDPCA